jgi:hypothetical protein
MHSIIHAALSANAHGSDSDSLIQFRETVMVTKAIQMREGTRVEMVISTVRQRIAGRSLTPGAKLPSVRGARRVTLDVSTSTVVDAYERWSPKARSCRDRAPDSTSPTRRPPLR